MFRGDAGASGAQQRDGTREQEQPQDTGRALGSDLQKILPQAGRHHAVEAEQEGMDRGIDET